MRLMVSAASGRQPYEDKAEKEKSHFERRFEFVEAIQRLYVYGRPLQMAVHFGLALGFLLAR